MSGRILQSLNDVNPKVKALKRIVNQFSVTEFMIDDDERKLVSVVVLEKTQVDGVSVLPQIPDGDTRFVHGRGSWGREGNGRSHNDGGGR